MKNALVRGSLLAWSMALLLSCGGGSSDGGGSATGFASIGASSTLLNGASGGVQGGATGADDGSTSAGGSTTAASGGDGSGVGSGGTGISTADAVGIGAVDGLGSIIVNGLRYNTDAAALGVDDAPAVQIGMTVKVTGPVNADFTSGVAKQVASAAEMRGPVSSLDIAGGSFTVMGTTVTTDESTVWADVTGLAGLLPGGTVQVWGLPAAPGVLRATRVKQRTATSAPIATGTVQNLNAGGRTFTLGSLTVDYGTATFTGGIDASTLANGAIVRVRAAGQAMSGMLSATLVEAWHTVPRATATTVLLAGVITDYASLGSFRLLGTAVDASAAQITGGPANAIGNGVKVEVAGTISDGVLIATKLKIRNIPGTGGPASFTLIGTVGSYNSAADFRVRGQPVNASGASVVFVDGTVANLANGTRVTVSGTQIVNGVLVADRVDFD
jgi:hypothetical protein